MTHNEATETNSSVTLVAIFGSGKLVQTSKGRLSLQGGTSKDYNEAKEWVSMFMPESIVQRP